MSDTYDDLLSLLDVFYMDFKEKLQELKNQSLSRYVTQPNNGNNQQTHGQANHELMNLSTHGQANRLNNQPNNINN